jgi:hypothetical protein
MEVIFESLKEIFTLSLILTYFDPRQPSIMEIDASDFGLGMNMSQKDNDEMLHLVAFYSRKFQLAEMNYQVYDKKY